MTFHKVNPFAPNSPVNPGMFVGRINELIRLEGSLIQARAARPVNFLITGERGIGKSSLLNYLKWVAEGVITTVSEAQLRFLVVDTDIDANTTNIGLIQKIRLGIDSALSKYETTRSFLKEAWTFLQRVEVGGVKLKSAERTEAEELLVEQFSYALADLATRITGKEQSLSRSRLRTTGVSPGVKASPAEGWAS